MDVLVTGITGFVGSNLKKYLEKQHVVLNSHRLIKLTENYVVSNVKITKELK